MTTTTLQPCRDCATPTHVGTTGLPAHCWDNAAQQWAAAGVICWDCVGQRYGVDGHAVGDGRVMAFLYTE